MGHHMRHIGQYKKKFIAMQAGDKNINIYREDYSKKEPYQSIKLDLRFTCSLEFHDFWIIGGNDGTFGAVKVL